MMTTEISDASQDLGKRLPGIVFCMRYGNDVGFVWRTIAQCRDLVAGELQSDARSYLAFPELNETSAHSIRWAELAKANFYDYSTSNKPRLAQFIRDHGISIVFFMSAWPKSVDLPFLRELGVTLLNSENDSYDHKRRQSFFSTAAKFIIRRVLGQQIYDLHIANSRGQYEFLRRYAQIPQRRLRVVINGIDTNHFQPGDRAAACERLGLDPSVCWIMAASQARPEKRVNLLIHAVQKARELRPQQAIGFFYVGDGQMLDEWRAIAADLPGADTFRFFGRQADLQVFYQAASIFIHGSSRESFGLVIAESMASGLPVLATYAHGPSEIIKNGVTGWLTDPDDWKSFIARLVEYLDDPALRQRHGDAGRQRCVEQFSIARQAHEIATLIRPFLL